MKAKIGISKVRPWKWMPFSNPARKVWNHYYTCDMFVLSTSINDSLFVIQCSCFVDYLYIYLQDSRLRTIQAKKSPCGGWFGFLIRQRRSSSCLVILKSRLHIFTMCHLWKCWYHVSWNLLYPLSIFRVIFLQSNIFRFKETLISFNNK